MVSEAGPAPPGPCRRCRAAAVATIVKAADTDAGQPPTPCALASAPPPAPPASTNLASAASPATGTTTGCYNRPRWDGRLHHTLYTWIPAHPAQVSPAPGAQIIVLTESDLDLYLIAIEPA